MPHSPDPSPRPQSAWLIAGCLLSVYVIWGTTYFAIKVGVQGSPPFFLIGTRFLVAGAVLTLWQLLYRRKAPRSGNGAMPRFWISAAGGGKRRVAVASDG